MDLPLVYIVFNFGSLGRKVLAFSDEFPWLLAFLSLFQALASRGIRTILKLILGGYDEAQFLQMPGVDAPQDFNIGPPGRTVTKTQRNARKKHFFQRIRAS